MVKEVITHSWGSRIVKSLWGLIIGPGMIICGIILVFLNEGNSLHTTQSLEQTEKLVIAIPNQPIDAKNDQKAVYFTGDMVVNDELKDPELGISSKGVKLVRNVEMYQWQEDVQTRTEKRMGGSEQEIKEYSYHQGWSTTLIDSAGFKEQTGHKNPINMKIKSSEKYAKEVKVGDFKIPHSLLTEIEGSTSLSLSEVDVSQLTRKLNMPVQHHHDGLYVGKNPEAPEIGDLKITASEILPQTVSIIAKQIKNTVEAYMPPAGREVQLISMGEKSSQAMFKEAHDENRMITWVLRVGSLLLIVIGIGLIMKPLTVLADFVPLIGTMIGMGTGLIAFLGGLILWTTATALAWFIVRPIIAIGMLIGVIGMCYGIYKMRRPKEISASPRGPV